MKRQKRIKTIMKTMNLSRNTYVTIKKLKSRTKPSTCYGLYKLFNEKTSRLSDLY